MPPSLIVSRCSSITSSLRRSEMSALVAARSCSRSPFMAVLSCSRSPLVASWARSASCRSRSSLARASACVSVKLAALRSLETWSVSMAFMSAAPSARCVAAYPRAVKSPRPRPCPPPPPPATPPVGPRSRRSCCDCSGPRSPQSAPASRAACGRESGSGCDPQAWPHHTAHLPLWNDAIFSLVRD